MAVECDTPTAPSDRRRHHSKLPVRLIPSYPANTFAASQMYRLIVLYGVSPRVANINMFAGVNTCIHN